MRTHLKTRLIPLLCTLPVFLVGCALNDQTLRQSKSAGGVTEIRQAGSTVPDGNTLKVPGVDSKEIKVADCVRFALEKNFGLRIARAAEKAAEAEVEAAKGAFDPTLGSSLVTSREDGSDWDGVSGSYGIAKKFRTGTEISLEAGDVYRRTGDFRDDYLDESKTSDLTLSIRQPLLRGGWGVNQTGIKLASLFKDQATATRTAEVLDMLKSTETAYWTAAVAGEMLERQRRSLQRSEKLHADVKARLDAGEASQLDVLEADVALAGAQERLVVVQRTAADKLEELWFVLGIPADQQPASTTFHETGEQSIIPGKPNAHESINRALTQSPTAVLLINEVERRNVELAKAKNGMLPRVDLEFDLDRYSSNATESGSSQQSNGSGYDAVALLRVSMPLTFRAERAELAKAKAELERSQASREAAELRLHQRISGLCRAIESGLESLRVAKVSMAAHQKKFQEQQLRHSEGLLSTQDLRLAHEELEASEMRELQARLTLLSDQSALGQLEGTLAGRHGISL